jgi:tetratricopeptide (TPR) repeat protein
MPDPRLASKAAAPAAAPADAPAPATRPQAQAAERTPPRPAPARPATPPVQKAPVASASVFPDLADDLDLADLGDLPGASLASPAPQASAPAEGDDTWGSVNAAAPVVTRLDTDEHSAMSGATSARKSGDIAAEWFRNGERFLKQRDLHNAVTSFREAVESEPKNPLYLYRLGQTLAHNPKWRKEAEEVLLQAIDLSPWDPKAHFALGKMYADAGLMKKAEARLKTTLEHEPGNAAARKLLAEVSKSAAKEAGGAAGLLGRFGITVGGSKEAAAPEEAPKESEEVIEV